MRRETAPVSAKRAAVLLGSGSKHPHKSAVPPPTLPANTPRLFGTRGDAPPGAPAPPHLRDTVPRAHRDDIFPCCTRESRPDKSAVPNLPEFWKASGAEGHRKLAAWSNRFQAWVSCRSFTKWVRLNFLYRHSRRAKFKLTHPNSINR